MSSSASASNSASSSTSATSSSTAGASASGSTAVSEPAPPARLTVERLAFLVCPVCHGGLALGSGSVDCAKCGRRFPVVDGLPVLLADRALPSR